MLTHNELHNIISQSYTSEDDSENEMSIQMFGFGRDREVCKVRVEFFVQPFVCNYTLAWANRDVSLNGEQNEMWESVFPNQVPDLGVLISFSDHSTEAVVT